MTRLLSSLLAAARRRRSPCIHREHEPTLDVLVGEVVDVERLADIPLDGAEVLALVPFRQVRERGFEAHDDGAPIRCLVVRERESVPLADALDVLPRHPVVVDDLDVDVSDADYAATVRRVIDEEIGRGEGANFVIRREFTGSTDAAPAAAVLGWLRALLEHESGAYWTFALHTPGLSAAGATPERHVSSIDGVVSMNPISGTFRHGDGTGAGAAPRSHDDRLLAFLHDVKEREELVMVVDEELKMMSAVCPEGGRIRGPFLKRMSRLTHTEYLLEGRSTLDPREVLRRTMFAPTVTGSPMGNACSVIARHETTPRGYYAGVLARFTPRGRRVRPRRADPHPHGLPRRAAAGCGCRSARRSCGTPTRRARSPRRARRRRACSRRSARSPASASRRAAPTTSAPTAPPPPTATAERIDTLLAARNDHLAAFWRVPQAAHARARRSRARDRRRRRLHDDARPPTAPPRLRRAGGAVARGAASRHPRTSWCSAPARATRGTPPTRGSPACASSSRPGWTRAARCSRSASATRCSPTSPACRSSGCRRRGRACSSTVDVFGDRAAIGFYNTFSALAPDGSTTPPLDLEVAADATTGVVHAMRGPGVASVQGHLESVTSPDGLALLERLVDGVLAGRERDAGAVGGRQRQRRRPRLRASAQSSSRKPTLSVTWKCATPPSSTSPRTDTTSNQSTWRRVTVAREMALRIAVSMLSCDVPTISVTR